VALDDSLRNGQKQQNSDIYVLLRNMEQNIEKLLESLEIEGSKHSPRTPNAIKYFVQSMMTDKNVLREMELFNQDIRKAIKCNEDRRLDQWSTQEELKSLENDIDELRKQQIQHKEEIVRLNAMLEKKNEENRLLSDQLKEVRSDYESSGVLVKESEDRIVTFINSFISFRDSIILKEGLCSDKEDETSKQLLKLLNMLFKETAVMAEKNKLLVLDQKGAYDSDKQIVTDVRPTKERELHDTVAETFRPGYRYQDKLIRPQEVILYSYTTE
jgi:molecular chaperone GrpE (heat shock protein)